MHKYILNRLKLKFDAFVRAHIVDDAKNLWPGYTDQELDRICSARR